MIRILNKDLKTFFLFTLILMVPSLILWNMWKSDKTFPVAVFVQLAFSYLITILTVLLNEQNEDTNNGYRFYQILPIKNRDVTIIKFLIPLLAVLILGLINRVIYSMFSVGNDILRLSNSITMIFSVLFLINSGFIIIGIYLLGYTKFIQFSSGILAVFVFGSLIVSKLFRYNEADLGRIANSIEQWLLHGNHVLFFICGLMAYTGMFLIAGWIEKK